MLPACNRVGRRTPGQKTRVHRALRTSRTVCRPDLDIGLPGLAGKATDGPVYLGVHRTTDVISGLTFGVCGRPSR